MFGIEYIYCSVTFDGTRDYYYRTKNRNIRPGDRVIVPVGKINAQKIGTVVATEFCKRKNVPYPIKKTKVIVSVAGKNAERQVQRYNRQLLRSIERKQQKQIKLLIEKNQKQLELEWIDRIEELDALLND